MNKYLESMLIMLTLTSCQYSINMVHSQGESSDAVDQQQESAADVSPTVSIPASVI